MKFVACSGFPVPVSRYWAELPAVEISETENSVPGAGTVRRWLRESADGFAFTVLAPKGLAAGGFLDKGKGAAGLMETVAVAKTLQAKALVFAAPPELLPSRVLKAQLRAFAEALPRGLPPVVFDLPAWHAEEVAAAVGDSGAHAAYNPLAGAWPTKAPFIYFRLHGPAGHRSRYEEAALEGVVNAVRDSKAKLTFCVFTNVDMFANAKFILKQTT
jgi:uncharacterized protein YecE (DUF72 family)